MARPRKALHEKRCATIKADLTVAEKLFVCAQADAAQLSLAAYTRQRVLRQPIKAPTSDPKAALLIELNRLGLSLQQQATDKPTAALETTLLRIYQALEKLIRS